MKMKVLWLSIELRIPFAFIGGQAREEDEHDYKEDSGNHSHNNRPDEAPVFVLGLIRVHEGRCEALRAHLRRAGAQKRVDFLIIKD